MGDMSNLSIKLYKKINWERGAHFGQVRDKRRESRERNFNFSLRSTELSCSVFVEPRNKVHLHDESYAWVPKTKDFAERSWVSNLRDF